MNTQNLPPLEFVLTPSETSKARYGTVYLEDRRRRLNERDTRRSNNEVANLLERALEEGA
ncbi:hypothetical protein [Lysobacter antibioticus]|uniref:Uncharacterized protein n=1 Tax=Lysobacter antibioticus TaxID=84531 RepID=A0A0S2F7F1_LYSAN|nr:hypothetical protein [Lysobacter antibioticus]ALN79484.1 hypothetical protein LA76x_1327 [Lysobacter antibioticus]